MQAWSLRLTSTAPQFSLRCPRQVCNTTVRTLFLTHQFKTHLFLKPSYKCILCGEHSSAHLPSCSLSLPVPASPDGSHRHFILLPCLYMCVCGFMYLFKI